MIELLLSLILAFTGIGRTVDPELTAIAERRAVEIQGDFSHAGMDPRYYEILHWNEVPDLAVSAELAAYRWHTSTTGHREIIHNPSLVRIGCAVSTVGVRHYWACVLAPGVQPVQPEPPVPPSSPVVEEGPQPVSPVVPAPAPVTLPDTAMISP